MASDSGDDAAALRERVAQLEETVAEQQATSESPEEPTASRRGLLSAAAGVAGLGALGIYSSYPASAQAAGQVGTASDPVDVEAYDLNVQGTATGLLQNPLTGDLDASGNSLTNVSAVETGSLSTDQANDVIWIDDTYDGLGEIGAAFNAARDDYPNSRYLAIRPGTYTQTTTLDLTSNRLQDVVLSLYGVELLGETGGQPMIDCTGSRNPEIYGGRLVGQSSNTPNVGLLLARDNSGANVGEAQTIGTEIREDFNVAALYNYAAETNSHFNSEFRQHSTSGYGVHITVNNDAGVTSPYVTIASGKKSNNEHGFHGCTVQYKPNDSTGIGLYQNGADGVVIDDGCLIASGGRAAIQIDTAGDASESFHFTDGSRTHPTSVLPDIGIEIIDSSGGAGGNLSGFHVHGANLRATNATIEQGTNPSIARAKVGPNNYNDGDAPIFQDISGQIFYDSTPALGNTTLQINDLLRSPSVVIAEDISINVSNPRTWVNGGSPTPADLSTVTPVADGEILRDNGSNTPNAAGEYMWADTGAGVWRAFSDPTVIATY